jgi:hypothetical protein
MLKLFELTTICGLAITAHAQIDPTIPLRVNARNFGATLDGVSLAPTDIIPPPAASTYRATSPLFLFRADHSLNQFDICVTGGIQPAVSDGYWIMLASLSPGNHELDIKQPVSGSTSLTITYRLFVPNH